jgi:hypothetical protein
MVWISPQAGTKINSFGTIPGFFESHTENIAK